MPMKWLLKCDGLAGAHGIARAARGGALAPAATTKVEAVAALCDDGGDAEPENENARGHGENAENGHLESPLSGS